MADTGELPAPPVPADLDLRDFPFLPVDIARLFASDFHALSSDAEWRAGFTLWMKAWHQVPAASVPDDDIILARLAEFARDVAAWRKVRDGALRGWIKCSDGRLYHPVVAEKARDEWDRKQSQRRRTSAATASRNGQRNGQRNVGRNVERNVERNDQREERNMHNVTLNVTPPPASPPYAPPSSLFSSPSTPTPTLIPSSPPISPPSPPDPVVTPGSKIRQTPAAKAVVAAIKPDGSRAWSAYADAYLARYGTEPIRNARVNSQLAQFCKRLPAEESEHVARWYVASNSTLYVRSKHCVDLLLRDAEGLRTEWATSRRVSDTEARQMDQHQAAYDAAKWVRDNMDSLRQARAEGKL